MGKTILHIWHFSQRNCSVHLPDHVLQAIISIAKKALPNETGGTLVGCYSEDRLTAYITQAFAVQTGGKFGRSWFFRPSDDVDTQLSKIYKKSKGRIYYIGEWHTHPKASSQASDTDKKTLVDIAKSPNVAIDTPLLLILGSEFNSNPPASCILCEPSGTCLYGAYVSQNPFLLIE